MKTDELIDMLARGAGPVRPAAVARRLAPILLIGLPLTAILAVAALGAVPVTGWEASATLTKLGYAGALAAALTWLFGRMARPGSALAAPAFAALLPAVALALVATIALLALPQEQRTAALLGGSALFCPFAILALSLPALAGLLHAMRALAPTLPTAAGLAAGLLAGAIGAAGYALTCTEGALPFIAIWYTSGIVLSGLAGALLGSRVLGW